MSKYQERTIYISSGVLIFFLLLSLMTDQWGFFILSLPPVYIIVMFAFLSKKTRKYNDSSKDILKSQ